MSLNVDGLRVLLKGLQEEHAQKLAELKDLERMIEKTRQYIGPRPVRLPNPTLLDLAVDTPKIADTRFAHMSTPEAAKVVLAEAGRPMRTAEIKGLLERGGIPSRAKNFTATLYTTLKRLADHGEITKEGDRWGSRHPVSHNE